MFKKKEKENSVETILEPTELLKTSLANCKIGALKIRQPKGDKQQGPQHRPLLLSHQDTSFHAQVQETGRPGLVHLSSLQWPPRWGQSEEGGVELNQQKVKGKA